MGQRAIEAVEIDEVSISEDEAIVDLPFITTEPGQAVVRIESAWWEVDGRPLLAETSVEA